MSVSKLPLASAGLLFTFILGFSLWSCGKSDDISTTTSTTAIAEATTTTTVPAGTTTTSSSTTTTSTTNPLRISAVTFSNQSIGTGETVTVTCTATNDGRGAITYSWNASAGTLSSTSGSSVNWTAPSTVNNYPITIEVSDGISPAVTQVATAHVETDVSDFNTPQIVYYVSQGNLIGGVLRKSSGTNLPAFIYTHGGSNPADLTGNPYTYAGDNILDNVQSLYGQACVVLAAGNYGDQPWQTGVTLTDSLKQNFYKEILDAIAYLKRKSYVNPDKIAIFGESRGGYNTVRALENGAGVKVASAWAVPATKSWCDPAITNTVNQIAVPLLNLHHISDETVSISDGRLLRDRFSSIFGGGYANYTYEELIHEGTVIGSFLVYHPGPYDWSFKTTVPWMTKTIQYFKDKGM